MGIVEDGHDTVRVYRLCLVQRHTHVVVRVDRLEPIQVVRDGDARLPGWRQSVVPAGTRPAGAREEVVVGMQYCAVGLVTDRP